MTVPAGFKGLLFPCECVSSRTGGYSDPWAEITKNKLLPNGLCKISNAYEPVFTRLAVVKGSLRLAS